MIISEIKMGLGNQLFQYAAGFSLSRYQNVPFVLDVSSYEIDYRREFCLKYFEINDIKTEIETDSDEDVYFDYYVEPHFSFDNSFFTKKDFTYLSGYWQSGRYFEMFEKDICERFLVKRQYIEHLNLDKLGFNNCQSVSLHIRRTDYIIFTFMEVLSLTYYYKAIESLKHRYNNLRFYIFSDDMDWVKQNFDTKGLDCIFVSRICTKNHLEDFYLMQQCKHHIIANSTFSWWTAWLSRYSDKQVIAPAKWFSNQACGKLNDLIPQGWLVID